jgi:hypothetical protein
MNPPRSASDGRQKIQLMTAMVPIELPVLSNLACRLLVKVLVRFARVIELSVPVPLPRRSAPAAVLQAVPKAEVEHKVLSPIDHPSHPQCSPLVRGPPLVAVDIGDHTLSLDLVPCGT